MDGYHLLVGGRPYVMVKQRKKNEVDPSKKTKNEVYASGQYIPISDDKARRVIDQIRGRSYEAVLFILELMPYRACYPILKLLYSAAANASHNKGFNKADLIISKVEVSKGTTMKKLKPRARGRSYLIKRSTCHITIVLKDISHFKEYKERIHFLENLPEDARERNLFRLKHNGGGNHNGVIWDKK